MVYLRFERDFFRYEIMDVLRLFFKNEDIVMVDAAPPEDLRGIFLFCRVVEDGECAAMEIRLQSAGYSKISKVPLCTGPIEEKDHERRKTLKSEVKRLVYEMLSEYTGKELPWGMLTGIRPGKLVHEMLENGYGKEDVLAELRGYYRVSREKADLLCSVAEVEREILDRTDPGMVSIYIGIPFCPTRCLYCSFTSNPIDKYAGAVKKYLEALRTEMAGVHRIIKDRAFKIQSVYIGGGTPTAIDAASLKELLEIIGEHFDVKNVEEYTLEAGRPDSIDEDKLRVAKQGMVGRISINPQTMNDETLRLIGRCHTSADIINAFKLARKTGLNNINMDVIVGLPGEDMSMFENTLREIQKLGPESLTVHTMAVKRASRLNEEKERFQLTGEAEVSLMIEAARKCAAAMGMHPYYLYRQKNMLGHLENIGYCKPGFEGIYNVQIMEERQTIIALGAGAVTKVVYPEENRIERAFNVKNVDEYISRVHEMVERKKVLLMG